MSITMVEREYWKHKEEIKTALMEIAPELPKPWLVKFEELIDHFNGDRTYRYRDSAAYDRLKKRHWKKFCEHLEIIFWTRIRIDEDYRREYDELA